MNKGPKDVFPDTSGKVLALCGGVGGAKLALGLHRILPPESLAIVANTGDDFEHLGLHVSPDLDTVLYTLAGLNNPETGWGRANETWTFMEALSTLGGESWFMLGDGDLAIHVERTRRLRAGETLTEVTRDFASRLGLNTALLPMSDDPVRTLVRTDEGVLEFQRYFVQLRCAPIARGFIYEGAAQAAPNPALMAMLGAPDLAMVVICPSNPYLSVDPILALPGVRDALATCAAPVVAVSPIVAGQAVKGPAAKIMAELGVPRTQSAIARHYEGLIDGLVVDETDVAESRDLALPVEVTHTLMKSLDDRMALAQHLISFAARLRNSGNRRRPTGRQRAGRGGA
ncbi:MAG TPA: 2-phospho-L-lactate transferase [Alphaproteobacteria bacterium]|nr:2-phospho-L-lactate transferase [Alphaproteobacteria bacterium]